jgi:hypothetical protein
MATSRCLATRVIVPRTILCGPTSTRRDGLGVRPCCRCTCPKGYDPESSGATRALRAARRQPAARRASAPALATCASLCPRWHFSRRGTPRGTPEGRGVDLGKHGVDHLERQLGDGASTSSSSSSSSSSRIRLGQRTGGTLCTVVVRPSLSPSLPGLVLGAFACSCSWRW